MTMHFGDEINMAVGTLRVTAKLHYIM